MKFLIFVILITLNLSRKTLKKTHRHRKVRGESFPGLQEFQNDKPKELERLLNRLPNSLCYQINKESNTHTGSSEHSSPTTNIVNSVEGVSQQGSDNKVNCQIKLYRINSPPIPREKLEIEIEFDSEEGLEVEKFYIQSYNIEYAWGLGFLEKFPTTYNPLDRIEDLNSFSSYLEGMKNMKKKLGTIEQGIIVRQDSIFSQVLLQDVKEYLSKRIFRFTIRGDAEHNLKEISTKCNDSNGNLLNNIVVLYSFQDAWSHTSVYYDGQWYSKIKKSETVIGSPKYKLFYGTSDVYGVPVYFICPNILKETDWYKEYNQKSFKESTF